MLIKNPKLLFFDPEILNQTRGVNVKIESPLDRRIVIENDRPWENQFIAFYSTYIYDNGLHRLFYTLRDADGIGSLAYAESHDGYNWEKPELGIKEYHGSKRNNLLGIESLENTIILEPYAPSDERYKCYSHHYRKGLFVHTSPDGINWNISDTPVMEYFCDSQNVVFYDKIREKYVFYLRGWDNVAPDSKSLMRTVKRGETDDIKNTPDYDRSLTQHKRKMHEQPYISDEFPTVLSRDNFCGSNTDIYTMAAQPCPGSDGYYIAFPTYYRHAPEPNAGGKYNNDGDIETYFAGSTDGIKWNLYDRNPYVKNEIAGRFKCRMAFVNPGIVRFGDIFRFYGTIYRTRHGEAPERKIQPDGKIICYEQRTDGFVAADFSYTGGEFITHPWLFSGDKITLNCDCGVNGQLRMELLDFNGYMIEGFSLDDCVPVIANEINHVVNWKNRDVSFLKGRNIRLRVSGASAKLYGITGK